jgi:hypothetical protein
VCYESGSQRTTRFMSRDSAKSPYHCSFCRERLTPLPLEGSDYLRALVLVRPFQCPHCFACVDRPFAWIARIPLIGWIAKVSVFSRFSKPKSGVLPTREGDSVGAVTKGFARFGRWVIHCERQVGRFFRAIARGIWALLWFIPGLFFGNRKGRSTKSKFLKPRR